jgi:hypothetical protein
MFEKRKKKFNEDIISYKHGGKSISSLVLIFLILLIFVSLSDYGVFGVDKWFIEIFMIV